MCNLLTSILRRSGYSNIVHVSHGWKAIDIISTSSTALAFLDSEMSGMISIAVPAGLGSIGTRCFCVIASSHGGSDNIADARDAGAPSFVRKPTAHTRSWKCWRVVTAAVDP